MGLQPPEETALTRSYMWVSDFPGREYLECEVRGPVRTVDQTVFGVNAHPLLHMRTRSHRAKEITHRHPRRRCERPRDRRAREREPTTPCRLLLAESRLERKLLHRGRLLLEELSYEGVCRGRGRTRVCRSLVIGRPAARAGREGPAKGALPRRLESRCVEDFAARLGFKG
jgi:hypothetical protein